MGYSGNKKSFNDFLNASIELLKENLNQQAIFDEYLLPKVEYIKEEKETRYVKNIKEQEIKMLVEEG